MVILSHRGAYVVLNAFSHGAFNKDAEKEILCILAGLQLMSETIRRCPVIGNGCPIVLKCELGGDECCVVWV